MFLWALSLGCGGSGSEPGLVPVKGIATWQGKPLVAAEVSFVPQGDTKGAGGAAATGKDGSFQIKYIRGGTGLPDGIYKVTFSKWVMPDGSAPPKGVSPMDSGAKESLPVRFSDPEKTTLTAQVTKDAKAFEFHLK